MLLYLSQQQFLGMCISSPRKGGNKFSLPEKKLLFKVDIAAYVSYPNCQNLMIVIGVFFKKII